MYCKSIFQLAFYKNFVFLNTYFLRKCPIFVDSDDSFGKNSEKETNFLSWQSCTFFWMPKLKFKSSINSHCRRPFIVVVAKHKIGKRVVRITSIGHHQLCWIFFEPDSANLNYYKLAIEYYLVSIYHHNHSICIRTVSS